MATAPTTDDVRAWSDLDFARFGYGTDARGETRLALQLARAEAYLTYITSRTYAQAQTDQFALAKLTMDQVVQMRTEQLIMVMAADQIETAGDIDLIASFGAGAYNETRRDTTTRPASGKNLNPWPALDSLLWMLLGLFPGEDNEGVLNQFDYWRFLLTGQTAPAWQAVEVDWGRGMGLAGGYWAQGPQNILIGPLPEVNDSRIG